MRKYKKYLKSYKVVFVWMFGGKIFRYTFGSIYKKDCTAAIREAKRRMNKSPVKGWNPKNVIYNTAIDNEF